MVEWLRERLKEKTSYAGVVGLVVSALASLGILVPADLTGIITAAVAVVASLFLFLTKEAPKKL
jgi:hypothetical protein